jgi:hypothetical protein|tara:strand:- start:369 stop:578 length:210 start_codon:yes stop_codon:yes gene_type:complete
MTTTPKKNKNNNLKRLPTSPGFSKRVVNTMSSPLKTAITNFLSTLPSPSSKKSKKRNNVNKALSKKIKK